jgi:phage terminase large subunit-like protein
VDGGAKRIALIGRTAADIRDVMIEGESGILNVFPDDERPEYEPSKRRLTFKNGAVAIAYSAEKPDQLRGPQHDTIWFDELCSYEYERQTWDMAMFGLRIGNNPQAMVTTTPRPTSLIREITTHPNNVLTRGSTYDNIDNLASDFVDMIKERYEGTTIGRQEIHADILDEAPGSLWMRATIEANRVATAPESLSKVVVGVDPAISTGGAETGIVVVGIDHGGHGYVLGDHSLRGSPQEWATRAINAYREHRANIIAAEQNQGGEMVRSTLATVDPDVPVKLVHASRGKHTRAEPIAAKAEQGKLHHVGIHDILEDQLCTWVPGESRTSPDRLDAMVWAATECMLGGQMYDISFGSIGKRVSPNRP